MKAALEDSIDLLSRVQSCENMRKGKTEGKYPL